MADLADIAVRAYRLAQRKEAAIILTNHGPIAVSTNTRDFRRSRPDQLIGIYNNTVQYNWILEDLKAEQIKI